MTAVRRPGRRPGDSGTREAILAAARRSFEATGFAGTTIRGIAGAAGVDPALVHHFFGTKQQLFGAALDIPFDPVVLVAELLQDGVHGLGQRIVGTFLKTWDGGGGRSQMLALLRTAVADEQAAGSLRDFLVGAVFGPLARAVSPDRVDLRAALVAAQMMGLAVARYVVRLEPLDMACPDELAPALGPTLDRYLTGRVGGGA